VPAPPVCRPAPAHSISSVSRRLSHIYLLSRQRGLYFDAANQGISNGHSL